MKGLLVAAPNSASGKTTVTCALLGALKNRGLDPCAFKCGPDYIDPMFHRSVLGVDSHNLDLFLCGEERVKKLFCRESAGHGFALCEGAMGLYDGLGGTTDRASAWHTADVLDLPILLVVRPKGASLTLAAQLRGLLEFRKNSHIAAILLNDCREMLYRSLAPMLERETGLPVVGYLPHLEAGQLQSRHLGLYTAGEIEDLTDRMNILSTTLEQTVDLDRLLSLCGKTPSAVKEKNGEGEIPIAVAKDEAFCFTYAETLEEFRRAGLKPVFFSPIHDKKLPRAAALYLPGGYPELYAEALSGNTSMLESIRTAVADGLPTVAECGGFLYLGRTLENEQGQTFPMTGVLPGAGRPAGRLVRFGYAKLKAEQDSLLFRAGEELPIHEFHYWDSTDNGAALEAFKPLNPKRRWKCGFVSETLYAGFPHLYFGGGPALADRLAQAARTYTEEKFHEAGEHPEADRP